MEYKFRLSGLGSFPSDSSREIKIGGRSCSPLYAQRGPIMSGVGSGNSSALLVCKDNEDLKSFYSEASVLESSVGAFRSCREFGDLADSECKNEPDYRISTCLTSFNLTYRHDTPLSPALFHLGFVLLLLHCIARPRKETKLLIPAFH